MQPTRAAIAGLMLLLACGDSSGPATSGDPPPVAVAIGDTVLADLRNDSLLTYTIHSTAAAEFAVFVQNEVGTAVVYLRDPAIPNNSLGYAEPATDPAPGHLTWVRTPRLSIAAGQTLNLLVKRRQGRGRTRFWIYPVDRAPEVVAQGLVLGATVTGEELENSADVDDFTVTQPAGAEVIAYARRLQSGGPSNAFLQINDPGGTVQGEIFLAQAAELQINHSGRVPVAQAGVQRVSVFALGLEHDSAGAAASPYELQLRSVIRAPETAPAILTAVDTVETEALDYVGDVDEYAVAVQAGEEFNLFLQASGSPAGLPLNAFPLGTGRVVVSLPGDSALAVRSTGRFAVAMTGTLTVRVEGDNLNILRGPYRLFLYRINRAPETSPASVMVGQTIAEMIDYPGDIDAYLVVPGAEDSVQLRLLRPSGPGWLAMRWGPPGQLGPPCPGGIDASDTTCSTYLVPAVAPGAAVEVLEPDDVIPGFRGAYTVITTGLTAAPETGSAFVSIGDTITGTIDPEADIDDFRFDYRYADLVDVRVIPQGPLPIPVAVLHTDQGAYLNLLTADQVGIGRFTLPASGTYLVRASGPPGSNYTFALIPVPVTTETAAAAVTLADSLTAESFDSLGDVDEFVLTAVPGMEAQAFLLSSGFGFVQLQTWMPGDTAPRVVGTFEASRRFSVPPGGEVRIRVLEIRGGSPIETGAYSRLGPYSLWFRTYDPAPETASPGLTLGVPVTTEMIDVRGDLDDFTFACSSGQILTATITASLPNDFSSLDPVTVQLLDPLSGAVLGSASTPDSSPQSTPAVTLTSSGTCRARVTTAETTTSTGAYHVLVQ